MTEEDDSRKWRKWGLDKQEPINVEVPRRRSPEHSPQEALQNEIARLAEHAKHPSAKLTDEQLLQLASLVALIDTQVVFGADDTLGDLMSGCLEWLPNMTEKEPP